MSKDNEPTEQEIKQLAVQLLMEAERAAAFKDVHKLPKRKPHRCALHLDDLLTSMANFGFRVPFKIYMRCIVSKPGSEPPRSYHAMALRRDYPGRRPIRPFDD